MEVEESTQSVPVEEHDDNLVRGKVVMDCDTTNVETKLATVDSEEEEEYSIEEYND